MRFAYIIMDDGFNPNNDYEFIGKDKHACIVGVENLEQATDIAIELANDGVDVIELCGAFGPEGAKTIIDATEGKVAIGYVTHLQDQDEMYNEMFRMNT